jgi:predicted transglutaminase-like cysteine proteinase
MDREMQQMPQNTYLAKLMLIAALTVTIGVGAAHAGMLRDRMMKDDRARFPATRIRASRPRQNAARSWAQVARESSTPRAVAGAVKRRIKYSRDISKEDEWRSGKDTWDRQEGDCEDFAATVNVLCEKNGIQSQVIVLRSKTARAAHAVTVGNRNGSVWVSSNGGYEEYQSEADAKQAMARELGWHAPEVEVLKVNETETDNGFKSVQVATDTWRD